VSTPTSPKSSDEPVQQFYRKPRADVFTVLLVIALLAIILATTVLWLVMQDYQYKLKDGPRPVVIETEAPAAWNWNT
jgi:hypothetical protein